MRRSCGEASTHTAGAGPRIKSGVTEEALDTILKARVKEALSDAAPSIPQAGVFAALRARHAKRTEA